MLRSFVHNVKDYRLYTQLRLSSLHIDTRRNAIPVFMML